MRWEEIRREYPEQWVLIEDRELDDQLNVVQGEVIAHLPSKEETYSWLLEIKGGNIAIEHTGALPKELAVIF